MKFYIATSLSRAKEHNIVRDELVAMGHTITYDWTVHGSVQNEGVERIEEVARLEADGVAEADLIIVMLPGGRGTHTELGMALASPRGGVIIHAENESALLDDSGRTCAFYHHPFIIGRVICPVAELVSRHRDMDLIDTDRSNA